MWEKASTWQEATQMQGEHANSNHIRLRSEIEPLAFLFWGKEKCKS